MTCSGCSGAVERVLGKLGGKDLCLFYLLSEISNKCVGVMTLNNNHIIQKYKIIYVLKQNTTDAINLLNNNSNLNYKKNC